MSADRVPEKHVPNLCIRIGLEEDIVVITDCATEEQFVRLHDWISSSPERSAIVGRAATLARDARQRRAA